MYTQEIDIGMKIPDSGVKLGIYLILEQRKSGGSDGILKEIGNLRITEEEQNTHTAGRLLLRCNRTTNDLATRSLLGTFLSTIINSNFPKMNVLTLPYWSGFFCLNLLGRKGGMSNILSQSFVS